jgi:hypothetical protein
VHRQGNRARHHRGRQAAIHEPTMT